MTGKTPFGDKYIHRDAFYACIFEPCEELDGHVITILGVIATALVKYFKVAVKEYLPGGEFAELSQVEARGVPVHNKFVERMFGYWKMLLHAQRPSTHQRKFHLVRDE